jgi:hypothetical protein
MLIMSIFTRKDFESSVFFFKSIMKNIIDHQSIIRIYDNVLIHDGSLMKMVHRNTSPKIYEPKGLTCQSCFVLCFYCLLSQVLSVCLDFGAHDKIYM